MTKIKIFIDKPIEKSAEFYFDKSKKAKKKLEGARKALDNSIKKLESMEKKEKKTIQVQRVKPKVIEWYEKFRWFFTSDGKLVIGGRDATTNEIVIKKHIDRI